MPVRVDCFNEEQRMALTRYENISGFEPMHQDEYADGDISFEDLWASNIHWLESVLAEVTNIKIPLSPDGDGSGATFHTFFDGPRKVV